MALAPRLAAVVVASAACCARADLQNVPYDMEKVVLAPSEPLHVRAEIGEAKFMRFSCMGGPADVIITFSSYESRESEPLLFLSMRPDELPTFNSSGTSNFEQWLQDRQGDHYVTARGVPPEGGVVGLVNVMPYARETLDGIISVQCSYIIAFDALFWSHLETQHVCPVGFNEEAPASASSIVDPSSFCSGRGACVEHARCLCNPGFEGPACEHASTEVVTAAEGHYRKHLKKGRYQYLNVTVPSDFPGGYLEVSTWSETPLVVLVSSGVLPSKAMYDMSNFGDWISGLKMSRLRFAVDGTLTTHKSARAKAGRGQQLYVGIYNHKRYYNDTQEVQVVIDVNLKVDPDYEETAMPSSWMEELYDPYIAISDIDKTQAGLYPDGSKYIYHIQGGNTRPGHAAVGEVAIYQNRLTLIHVDNGDGADTVRLLFTGTNVSRALVSTLAVPKTLFDFNAASFSDDEGYFNIMTKHEPAVWVAVWGKSTGIASVVLWRTAPPASSNLGVTVFVSIILCCVVCVGCAKREQLEELGLGAVGSLGERLWCWVKKQTRYEASDHLMTTKDGFAGPDTVDQEVEDQYLHRGGIGDDGI